MNGTGYDQWLNSTASGFNGTNIEGSGTYINYDEFRWQQLVANNIAVASVTLFGWETLTTLGSEWTLYIRALRGSISKLPVILFALVRYGSIPAVVLPAYSVWQDFTDSPSGCLKHQQICIAFVQLIVSCVFVWRTVAIWRRERWVVIFLIALTITQFALSFFFLWFSPEKLLPNGACMPVQQTGFFDTLPWFYLMSFIYDCTLAGMSAFKLWQYTDDNRTSKLRNRNLNSSGRVIVVDHSHAPSPGSSSEKGATAASHPGSLNKVASLAAFPVRTAKTAHRRYLSLPPLLTRLLGNGIQYFLVASCFNVVNLALEFSKSIHAKSLIALYAPVMAVACQRVILLEVQAVWGSSDRHLTGSRERSLVDRAMRGGRESWEGDDGERTHARTGRRRDRDGSYPASTPDMASRGVFAGASIGVGVAMPTAASLAVASSAPSSPALPSEAQQAGRRHSAPRHTALDVRGSTDSGAFPRRTRHSHPRDHLDFPSDDDDDERIRTGGPTKITIDGQDDARAGAGAGLFAPTVSWQGSGDSSNSLAPAAPLSPRSAHSHSAVGATVRVPEEQRALALRMAGLDH